MPTGNATSRHRADAPARSTLPRPIRRIIGAAGLAVVLAGSLAFAATQTGEQGQQTALTGAESGTVANSPEGRNEVWSQASRSGSAVRSVEALKEAEDAVTFSVTVDGKTLQVSSNAASVSDALVDNGIVVGLEDNVSVPMNSTPEEGMTIEIERVGVQHGTETKSIPFKTIKKETDELLKGEQETETKGVNGTRVISYTAEYLAGKEVSRTVQADILVSEPVNEVVLIGTGEEATYHSPSSSDSAPSGSYSGTDPRSIGQKMAAARGWTGREWSCLESLWQRESNWNPYADNPNSSAYGIPQALPGSKMASAGSDWRTNPATQIEWGLNYIDGRYGSPCGAWGHSQSVGWY